MAMLTEIYALVSDDETESLEIKKDCFGNIQLVFTAHGATETMLISEEFARQFTHVLNRIC